MKRRNGIKVGVKDTQRKVRKNKVILHFRIKPELQEFIDNAFNNGEFKTKTAVVESALEFLQAYMTSQRRVYDKYGLTPPKYSDINLEIPEVSPSDSA